MDEDVEKAWLEEAARRYKDLKEGEVDLIRIALEHELSAINKRLELADMAKAFEAMREDSDYERESAILGQGLMDSFPDESENWWQG